MKVRALFLALSLSLIASLVAVSMQAAAGQVTPIRLRVMTFNIQYGAQYSPTGLDAVVEAIEAADADVVGLQEPYGLTRKIARLLGWYAAPRLHVVSRFPIVFPEGSRVDGSPGGRIPEGVWGYLLLGDGAVAAIAQTHTPWWPDGIVEMKRGASEQEVLDAERGKIAWLRPHLDAAAGPIGDGLPVFFVGDLNSASHEDWTPEAVAALGWQPPTLDPVGERYPVAWPVTLAMEDAGFRDSYRQTHPDPVADPGFTYCVDQFPACGPWDTWDRIDYVYGAGPADVLRSRTLGEHGPYTDIVVKPWPTDHRAVVSTFDVDAVTPPPFAAPIDERVFEGRNVRIAFASPADAGRTVGLWPAGSDPASDPPTISAPVDDAADDGVVRLDTAGLDPAVYTAAMLDGGGSVSARSAVSIAERGEPATIVTSARRYDEGEPIEVEWTGATGNRYDWLALNRNCFDAETCALRQWRYVDGRVHGSAMFTRGSEGVWPLRPGRYAASLCVDDDYRCVATSAIFRVVRT